MPDPVPVPLTEIERLADDATDAQSGPLNLTDDGLSKVELIGKFYNAADPPTVRALCGALRIAVNIASEAVGRLGQIGNIYSLAYAADITETEALTQMEVALRGAPPEGDIAFYVLAERLAAVRELVDLGEKP